MPVKGLDDGNNLHDVYTTNESLSILQQAIDSGSMQGIDPSLNPVVEAIQESHADNNLTFWQGTEAEFNELGISGEILGAKIDSNGKIYVLTGDTTLSDAVANAAAAAEQVLGNKADISTVNALASAINGTVLFETTSSVIDVHNLNDSIGNYDYLDVFLCDVAYSIQNPNVARIPVLSNSFTAQLTHSQVWSYNNKNFFMVFSMNYTFSDTSMIHGLFVRTQYSTAQSSSMADLSISSSQFGCNIYKVVGYKKIQ